MSDRPEINDPFRNVALLGLLGLSPLAIMLSHWSEGLFHDLVPQQQVSVDLFFTIEGLLTAALLARTAPGVSLRSLIGDRIAKVYPLLVIGTVFGLLVFLQNMFSTPAGVELTRTSDLSIPEMGAALLRNLLFLPNLPHDGHAFPFDPPTWAIVVEVYAFIAICAFRRWITLPRLIVFTALIAALFAFALSHYHDVNLGFRKLHYWGGLVRCLYGFCTGMLLHHLVTRTRLRIAGLHPLLIWGMFAALLFVHVPRNHVIHAALPSAMIGIPLIVWLAATARNPAWLQPIADHAGRLCYPLYMLHFPVLMLCSNTATRLALPLEWLATPWYYLVSLALVLGVCHAATRLVERVTQSIARRRNVQPA
jgi:peptidoglycan/LPS O-acetylase OafA/YrhL